MKVNKVVDRVLSANQPIYFEGRPVHPRNSDKALIIQTWQSLGLSLSYDQTQRFMSLASPETIRRVRQKIQEKGLYPADELVTKERQFKSFRLQQISPKASPKYLENTLL